MLFAVTDLLLNRGRLSHPPITASKPLQPLKRSAPKVEVELRRNRNRCPKQRCESPSPPRTDALHCGSWPPAGWLPNLPRGGHN